jgi:hypothetical protein
VENSTLQDALEAQRRLHVVLIVVREQRRLLIDTFGELPPEFRDIGVAGLEDLVHLRDVELGQQQVLNGHELVSMITSPLKGLV